MDIEVQDGLDHEIEVIELNLWKELEGLEDKMTWESQSKDRCQCNGT